MLYMYTMYSIYNNSMYHIQMTNFPLCCIATGLAGPIKDILLIFSSVIIFHDIITVRQLLGFSITLVSLYCYKIYKSNPHLFRVFNSRLKDPDLSMDTKDSNPLPGVSGENSSLITTRTAVPSSAQDRQIDRQIDR